MENLPSFRPSGKTEEQIGAVLAAVRLQRAGRDNGLNLFSQGVVFDQEISVCGWRNRL